jgi:hypothetical protein
MRSILSSKEGQIQGVAPAVIALIVAGFFLVMGMIILETTRNTSIITQSSSGNAINESTVAVVNETGTPLVNGTGSPGVNGCVVTVAMNVSGQTGGGPDHILDATNYTVTDGCFISFAAAGEAGDAINYNNSIWNVTYSYNHGGEAYVGANSTLVGLATFASFWEIIVLAIVIGVIIGMLILAFGTGSRR